MYLDEARANGASLTASCRIVGLDPRTIQRWRISKGGDDMRMGPKTKPANSLSKIERGEVLRVINLPEFRDLPPKQIVPRLADSGKYVASESTMERILRAEGQKTHRGPKRRKSVVKPREKTCTSTLPGVDMGHYALAESDHRSILLSLHGGRCLESEDRRVYATRARVQ